MRNNLKKFDWSEEIHKTVTHSLATSFGLDFLLFDDKKGGDVDTIHNVRQGVYATDKEKKIYNEQGEYNRNELKVGQHENFINKSKRDSILQEKGELRDAYTGKIIPKKRKYKNNGNVRHVDHVISVNEIYNDPARVLANLDTTDLASKESNLKATNNRINSSKSSLSVDDFLNNRLEKSLKSKDKDKNIEKTKQLESIKPELMKEADRKSREDYNKEINSTYYSSSKFLKNTSIASIKTGVLMGTRQALGLVLAEVWFELREQIPVLYEKQKNGFQLSSFINHLIETIKSIFNRVKKRFKDLLITFKDSALGGMLSSITTTILNIFLTTEKIIGRLIRETWNSLVQAIKLIFFNPKNLTLGDLAREVTRLLGAGLSLFMGVYVHQHLGTVLSFPLGAEISAFIGALVTGIMTVGLSYFLDHNEMMQKVWRFLDQFKSKYRHTLEYFQKVNTELDRYLTELAKIELNMNPEELRGFTNNLIATKNEYERSLVLSKEVERRGIDLPFEAGNTKSTRNWLASL